jgi:hypothetical protein
MIWGPPIPPRWLTQELKAFVKAATLAADARMSVALSEGSTPISRIPAAFQFILPAA